jgi:hypothetical protein
VDGFSDEPGGTRAKRSWRYPVVVSLSNHDTARPFAPFDKLRAGIDRLRANGCRDQTVGSAGRMSKSRRRCAARSAASTAAGASPFAKRNPR